MSYINWGIVQCQLFLFGRSRSPLALEGRALPWLQEAAFLERTVSVWRESIRKKISEMRPLFTSLVVASLAGSLYAQHWAPIGATWHYPWTLNNAPPDPPTSGTYRFVSLLDTTINGQATRKVDSSVPTNDGPFYTHDVDGVAYIYVPATDAFDTLFNFNAIPGDRWTYVPMPFPLACTDESWVEVVDTGTTIMDALPLRWLAVNKHDVAEGIEYVWPDTIIERLGPLHSYMLPHEQCNTLVSPGVIGGLLCYSDAAIAYMDPSIGDCALGMGLASAEAATHVQLYPNPGLDGFMLTMPTGSSSLIAVYDARGVQVHGPEPIATSIRVDTSEWPSGLYSIHLLDDRGRLAKAQWVKH